MARYHHVFVWVWCSQWPIWYTLNQWLNYNPLSQSLHEGHNSCVKVYPVT